MVLQVHPVKGNVAFSAANSAWSFTLRSFSQLHLIHLLDLSSIAALLLGEYV